MAALGTPARPLGWDDEDEDSDPLDDDTDLDDDDLDDFDDDDDAEDEDGEEEKPGLFFAVKKRPGFSSSPSSPGR